MKILSLFILILAAVGIGSGVGSMLAQAYAAATSQFVLAIIALMVAFQLIRISK